ncbi:MAG: transglutaminaseTgpA domain-containing protein, partial [Jatrophihabitans sp.]|uniref:transglutaminase family protein n=1 Tax=Jatrophihabitans sp. TaxID=1932789 RepID=UPI003F7F50FF
MTATLPRPAPAPPGGGAPPPRRPAPAAPHAARSAAPPTLLAVVACALGAVSLKALFRDLGWLVEVWATLVVVIGPALLLRLRREAAPWHIWPGLVLLVPWLTVLFVPQHAIGQCIPTSDTWHDVTGLLADLHRTSNNEVAPIQSTRAVRLVLCAMLGLLAALVDLIAVVGRHGALGGVPLLVTFTLAGAVPKHPVSWPLFLFAAVGFLMLLALDARDTLADWGRRIPRPGGGRHRGRLGISAVRLGLVALLVALLLPLAVPARSGNALRDLFRSSGGAGGGLGVGGGNGRISPLAALAGELHLSKPQKLFTVHLEQGSGTPFYARVNVLTDYTGGGWQRGPSGDEEPIEQTAFDGSPSDLPPGGHTYRATISVTGLRGNPPVFDRPSLVSGVGRDTRWSRDELLLVGDNVDSGQTITEQWTQPVPTLDELNAARGYDPALESLTQLPDNLPATVRSLVGRLTANQPTEFAAARAIYDFFTNPVNNFQYSLSTKPGDSGSDLVDFLHNRAGFCQQYAAAMAVMLRVADIPSRVVLGYTHRAPDRNGNFTVTTDEAHSWVEAWFNGVGWVPFDPTPLDGIAGGAAADPPYARHPTPSLGPNEPTAPNTTTGPRRPGSVSTSVSAPSTTTTSSGPSSSVGTAVWVVPLVILAVAVVVLLPAALREARRRRRRADAARDRDPGPLWAELADTAVDLGLAWSPARSPRQVAAWLTPEARSVAVGGRFELIFSLLPPRVVRSRSIC